MVYNKNFDDKDEINVISKKLSLICDDMCMYYQPDIYYILSLEKQNIFGITHYLYLCDNKKNEQLMFTILLALMADFA